MADIKTRDAVKGTIKTIDKAAIASERMKSAYVGIKEKAEQGYYADENSATEYAADRISFAADRAKDEGVHQFNKQGQKAVKTTQENIGKAKDKITDFKQSRAVKAAEQKAAQNMSEQHGLQIRHGAASRSSAPDVSQTAKSQLIKTRQQGQKMIKSTARNAEKAVKTTAKGTVKTTEKGIKTAQATSKAASLIYGLLGANGAGKTTLMRLLCDIQTPTSGKITLDGKNISVLGEKYRNLLGYLPQQFGYYPDFTAWDFLMYVAALKGLSEKQAHKKATELLEAVDLAEKRNLKSRMS